MGAQFSLDRIETQSCFVKCYRTKNRCGVTGRCVEVVFVLVGVRLKHTRCGDSDRSTSDTMARSERELFLFSLFTFGKRQSFGHVSMLGRRGKKKEENSVSIGRTILRNLWIKSSALMKFILDLHIRLIFFQTMRNVIFRFSFQNISP